MAVALRYVILSACGLLLSACVTNVVADKAARFERGVAAYDAGDFGTAYDIWSELAEEDDLAAMRNTAQLLRQGKGVEKNPERAFRLYKEAAEKGLVTAMANVGDMYLAGEGVEKDVRGAVEWYARAATAGLSLAQAKLADLYEQGVGVERDPARARALLERAARNGYAPAQAKLAALNGALPAPESTGSPDDPWQNGGTPATSIDRAPSSRPTPDGPVPPELRARMSVEDLVQLHTGLSSYAAHDHRGAFETWRNVAVTGNADAQLRVGLMYERGEGVAQDMIEAYRWLKLAATQGHSVALAELSIVSSQLAPAERVLGDSLVKAPLNSLTKPR